MTNKKQPIENALLLITFELKGLYKAIQLDNNKVAEDTLKEFPGLFTILNSKEAREYDKEIIHKRIKMYRNLVKNSTGERMANLHMRINTLMRDYNIKELPIGASLSQHLELLNKNPTLYLLNLSGNIINGSIQNTYLYGALHTLKKLAELLKINLDKYILAQQVYKNNCIIFIEKQTALNIKENKYGKRN